MMDRQGRGALKLAGCVLLAAYAAACGPQAPAESRSGANSDAIVQELMEADRAFNLATQAAGAEGWVSFFDSDGAMIQAGVGEIRGLQAIRTAMEGTLAVPGVSLTWDPTRAHVSNDGSLGFTVGTYVFTSADSESPVGNGLYVSIWRRQEDGSWKVMMDLGNPTS
jgi:ketosteroid isomerase-like protein